MSVPLPVLSELQKLRDEVARLRQDKGQSESLVHLLQEQNQRFSEEIFDLNAQIVAVEAEASYKCEQNELSMQHQLKRLVSHTTFLQEEKKAAERARQVLESQLKQFQTTAQLEQKRLEAGKRLLETSKRKLEAEKLQMSQQLFSQVTPPPPMPPSKRPRAEASTISSSRAAACVEAGFQTDPYVPLAVENSEVIGNLLQSSSDLTMLLHPPPLPSSSAAAGQGHAVSALDVSEDRSMLDTTTDLSQLMPQFSQWLPPVSSTMHPSTNHPTTSSQATQSQRPSKAITFQLTSIVASMLAGTDSAVAMVAPLLMHLQPQFDHSIVCSALHVLYALIQGSHRLQDVFRPTQATPRLSRLAGPTAAVTASLVANRTVDPSGVTDAVASQDLLRKLLQALGRLLETHGSNANLSGWTEPSMRVQQSICSVVSALLGLLNVLSILQPSPASADPANTSMMLDQPASNGWMFAPIAAPLCDVVSVFLAEQSVAAASSSNGSLTTPTDEGGMPQQVAVVVDALSALSHLASQPLLLPILEPHLGKWWTQLVAITPAQPTAIAHCWAVHVAVLKLMQNITTLYPSQAWHVHHPKAVDALWEVVKRVWKTAQPRQSLEAWRDDSTEASEQDKVLVVALNMLAAETLTSNRSGRDVLKQQLVDEIDRAFKARIEKAADYKRQGDPWVLVHRALVTPNH